MRRLLKVFVAILMVIAIMPYSISANDGDNRISVFQCDGPHNSIRVISESDSSIYSRLGVFATPGSTLTVNTSYSTIISSNANFTIFPELFEMGYERSINAGIDIGWSKTNTTNTNKELVILEIYDTVRATEYYEVRPGLCAIGVDTTYTMPVGWAFDLR